MTATTTGSNATAASATTTVAVLGLGPMGVALARALAAGGSRVRVWNRTPRTLAEHGLADVERDGSPAPIELADDAAAAVAGADLVVVCVRDHTASRALLETVAPHLDGAVLVNVSTGSPDQATRSARHAEALGVRYVTGAVMVPTPMVGTDDCLVLYAGEEDDVTVATAALTPLGGTADVVGTDHAVPPVLDLAMLDIYFAGMYAFMHAAALVGRQGVTPARFLPYAQAITETLNGSLPGLAASATERTYRTGDARLGMCLAFQEHILTASEEARVPTELPALMRDASRRAERAHGADIDWDVVAEELLGPR